MSGTADRDDLFGTFDGKVVKLTPATAQAGATAALAKRDPKGHRLLLDLAYERADDPSILGLAGHLLYIGEGA